MDKSEFITYYLEKKPMVIRRKDASYFQELLTLENVGSILRSGLASKRITVNLKKAYSKIDSSKFTRIESRNHALVSAEYSLDGILELFEKDQCTILINSADREWPPLRSLIQSVQTDLQCQSGVNLFITPGSSQCFEWHYDEHDLFILQCFGKKKWKIFESYGYLPNTPQAGRNFDFSDQKVLYDIELQVGDVLYLPRGFVHEVTTNDTVSCHVTLGCVYSTWADFLKRKVLAAAIESPKLRTACKAGPIDTTFLRERIINALGQEELI